MKNKKNIYILLPIVLLIWSAVIYQIFSYLDSDSENIAQPEETFRVQPIEIKKNDSVTINTQYRDPFLGKIYHAASTNKTKINSGKKSPQAVVQWPEVIYKGIVSDTRGKTKVFMLIIEGRTSLMKVGQSESEVILKSGDRGSIQVSYKGETNSIRLDQ